MCFSENDAGTSWGSYQRPRSTGCFAAQVGFISGQDWVDSNGCGVAIATSEIGWIWSIEKWFFHEL